MSELPQINQASERPWTGALLANRYRLGARIGRGGVADVFAAYDEVLHRRVAVKLFRFETPTGDDRRRIDAEIRTLAGLRNPGLVTVFDAVGVNEHSSDDVAYIVMELVDGPTLRQRIDDGPLPPDEVAYLGATLAATLAYVHAQGIVHRDIKPANILLDPSTTGDFKYTAKLTDFGIARLMDSTRLTTIGTTVGTANYLSPEQAVGGEIGPSTDVYSLGLVLLECLTGRVVYPGSGVHAALARLNVQPVVAVEFGPRWTHLLTTMTARDPALRPSASEVAHQLSQLSGETTPEQFPETGAAATEAIAVTGGLSAADSATTAVMAQRSDAGATRVLPSVDRVTRARRLPRPAWVALVGAAIAIAIVVLVVLMSGGGGHGAPKSPAPTYPSVSGTIGNDLRGLEGAVG